MGLDSVELVIAVEKEFNIEIPDQVAADLDTVQKLFDYVMEQLNQQYPEVDETLVLQDLTRLIVDQLGVKPEQVTLDAHFVNDLRID